MKITLAKTHTHKANNNNKAIIIKKAVPTSPMATVKELDRQLLSHRPPPWRLQGS